MIVPVDGVHLHAQFAARCQGIDYSVFDVSTSQTIRFICDEYNVRDPFEGLTDPKIILDLGAHCGLFSLLAAIKFPNAHVYAVEPNQINLVNLHFGIGANNLKNVTIVPVAVRPKNEMVNMTMELGNTGSNTEFADNNFRTFPKNYPFMVQTQSFGVTLNHLFETIGHKFDFVKCDIEGSEFHTFPSFRHWNRIGQIHMEIHPYSQTTERDRAKALSYGLEQFVRDNMRGKRVNVVHPDFPEGK